MTASLLPPAPRPARCTSLLALYAAIVGSTADRAAAALSSCSSLEGALARRASYAHDEDADLALQAAVLTHSIAATEPFSDGNK